MGSGATYVNGVVLGTGAKITVNGEKCGFKPSRVELHNKSGLCKAVWTDMMPDGTMQKTVDSGAGTTDVVNITDATKGVNPVASGFEIGTDTDINASGEAVFYTAWQ